MAFTSNDDLNVLQPADILNVGAGDGADTYVITPNLDNGQVITISDDRTNADGTTSATPINTMWLIEGLTIVSSTFATDSAQLVVRVDANGNTATININGASSFIYTLGGNPLLDPNSGVDYDYIPFVIGPMGAVEPVGTAAEPGAADTVVNADGTTSNGGGDDGGTFTLTVDADPDTAGVQLDFLTEEQFNDDLTVFLTEENDEILAPLDVTDLVSPKNTLTTNDVIWDPSSTDADTLDADLVDDLGTNGGAGAFETGPIIRDIENITLHGTQNVNAYSLLNVTSSAIDDLTTEDVNEGATVSVNIDHGGTEKFTSTTDIDLSIAVSNVDGNDIKEVNLIENTRAMAVAEISNNPDINLTNGEINALALDALDNATLATEDVTVNLLNDADGELVLGLHDDDDDANPATHDGGGFENINLVTSDVAMNVILADGTHLRNGVVANAIDTEANGTAALPGASEGDNGQTAQPTGGQDNLTDQLNLSGTEDITITGTDEQLDQAVIRTDMTGDAISTLDMTIATADDVVNLTDAEVDVVNISTADIGADDGVTLIDLLGVTRKAMVAVDDNTVAEITDIGNWVDLTVTGDAERTDNIELIINTGQNTSAEGDLGKLILGGDDRSQSETAANGSTGDSTEAGFTFPATTQGADADNAILHIENDSIIRSLDISNLLGTTIIDGSGDFRIENGGLLFDDITVEFNGVNNFVANTAAEVHAEGESTGTLAGGQVTSGFGGDWIDATAMTGDFRAILRDGGLLSTPMSNNGHGIRIDLGEGDDTIVGAGTAVSVALDGLEAGDNIDMGAGDDTIIIGVNDTTDTLATGLPIVGTVPTAFNILFNTVENNDDRTVTALEQAAEDAYNLANITNMAHDRINVEVYLDGPDGGSHEDHVIFQNQNSGFLADNNGVRIKDFEAGNDGDTMGFQMFRDGQGDGPVGAGYFAMDNQVTQGNLDLFNNGEVIADSETSAGGKYTINGTNNPLGGALDTGANDGNVVLISTADIHAFTSTSASNLWAPNTLSLTAGATEALKITNGPGVFEDVVNVVLKTTNNGQQYETIVLVGETTGTEGVKIFYVTDDPTLDSAAGVHSEIDGTPTASLVGLLEGININDLHADNFDFM